jgi:hypothetical protein
MSKSKQTKHTLRRRSVLAVATLALYGAYRRLRRQLDEAYQVSEPDNLHKVGLSRDVYLGLPRLSYLAGGRPMEWMNLVLVGQGRDIEQTLQAAGWYRAREVAPWSIGRAFWAILTHGQYLHGPVTPLFVGKQVHAFGYQKPTESHAFAQRHHARFWQTEFTDELGQPIWIAHASFDKGIKGHGRV